MLNISLEAKKKKKWSGDVETKWHPPEGFFEQSPAKIASELKKNSKNRQQAMGRLNFYINRAGKNLSKEDKERLEKAKVLLAAMYDAEEKKGKKKVSKEEFDNGALITQKTFAALVQKIQTKFNISDNDYIVSSGGALLMYGLREHTRDVDMSVSERVWKTLIRNHKVTDYGRDHPLVIHTELDGVEVEFYADFNKVKMPSVVIDGVRVLHLEGVLYEKEHREPKTDRDYKDIENIKKKIASQQRAIQPKNRSEFIRSYKDFLSRTHMRPEEAVVGAGGACLMFGIRKTTNDMDLAVSEKTFDVLLKSGKYNTREYAARPDVSAISVLEWNDFIDLHASDMDTPTTIIDGVCCWTPEYTLDFKKRLNRPKDQEDIKALERLLKKGISFECHPSSGW